MSQSEVPDNEYAETTTPTPGHALAQAAAATQAEDTMSDRGIPDSMGQITMDDHEMKSVGQEHSFLMDRSDVEQMEQGLLCLLDDFKSGRLHAFGEEFSMEKMNRVRNLQVKLAQLHFELEEEETFQRGRVTEDVEERKGHEKLDKLMKNLENLCSSLQSLHQPDKE